VAKEGGVKVEALRQWRRLEQQRKFVIAGACAALVLLAAIIGAILWSPSSADRADGNRSGSTVTARIEPSIRLTLPPPDLYQPITPEEALKENAARAFSGRPDTAAAAFKLQTDKATSDRALECLTQAVYYEAASEGADGQRAVAQIVLNRMRHPAYPASVCGVVYQGSERTTGCQFTFTCDGSLARAPAQSLWKQARRIASEALAGKVFAPVGHATHYHADYVVPYWAASLDKSIQIGRHIFYRLKAGLGARGTFRQRYAGAEPMPLAPTAVEVSLEAVQSPEEILTAPAPPDPLQVSAGELVANSQSAPTLAADAVAGGLLIDGDTPVRTTSPRKGQSEECRSSDGKRLRPMGANDVRSGSAKSGC
jgi:spore germination cell wall hydrolase CwlJ-like protein